MESEKYSTSGDPVEPLSEIIQFLNDAFGEDAPAAYEIAENVKQETAQDVAVVHAIRANSPEKARLTIDDIATQAFAKRYDQNVNVYRRFSDDEYVRKRFLDWIADEVLKDKRASA